MKVYEVYFEVKVWYDKVLVEWCEVSKKVKEEKKKVLCWLRVLVGCNDRHASSCLFNGMIQPIVSFTIRGAIWYQGESNVGCVY